jgi:hypothetical protein
MKNDNLIYEWLEFLARQKVSKPRLIQEQEASYTVSSTNPGAAKAFGDWTYVLGSGDSVKWTSGGPSLGTAVLKCATNGSSRSVRFHKNYINNLEKAYYEGSKASGYCPSSAGTYVARKVRKPGETRSVQQIPLSNHSFGTAIDFNPSANRYSKGSEGEIESFPGFISAFQKNGFRWLGDSAKLGINGPGDDMHFDIPYEGGTVSPTNTANSQSQQPPDEGSGSSYDSNSVKAKYAHLGKTIFKSSAPETNLSESVSLKGKISIKDNTDAKIYKKHRRLFNSLLSYLNIRLKPGSSVEILLEEDPENSSDPLGKTGGYYPDDKKIILFSSDRHIKDILRSLSHEMIHHKQNCEGRLKANSGLITGYAQKNKRLRELEKEAYLDGNMLFRDWEDTYKQNGEK